MFEINQRKNGGKSWLCTTLEKTRLRDAMDAVLKHLKGCQLEERVDLFSIVHLFRIKGWTPHGNSFGVTSSKGL